MPRSWYDIDASRTPWLFLAVGPTPTATGGDESTDSPAGGEGVTPQPIEYWELAAGNVDQLVETDSTRMGTRGAEDEAAVLTDLLSTLDEYRHAGRTLLTPDRRTMYHLRRRLVGRYDTEITPSLRGFDHLAVATLVENHFEWSIERYGIDLGEWQGPVEASGAGLRESGLLDDLWQLWRDIVDLLPPPALDGDPL